MSSDHGVTIETRPVHKRSASSKPTNEHIEHTDDGRSTTIVSHNDANDGDQDHVTLHPNRWSRYRSWIREPAAEFLGTMILIIFGTGVDCQVVLTGNPSVAASAKGVRIDILCVEGRVLFFIGIPINILWLGYWYRTGCLVCIWRVGWPSQPCCKLALVCEANQHLSDPPPAGYPGSCYFPRFPVAKSTVFHSGPNSWCTMRFSDHIRELLPCDIIIRRGR